MCLLDGCSFPHCFLRSTDLCDEYMLDDLVNKGTPSNELHCKGKKKVSLSKMNIQHSKIPLSIPGEGKRIQITALSSFQTRVCSCLGVSLSPSIPNFSENGQFFLSTILKEINPGCLIGRTDAEVETPVLWLLDAKS